MGNGVWRDYPSNPREFDGWLQGNAVLRAQSWRSESLRWRWQPEFCRCPDGATVLSSVTAPK